MSDAPREEEIYQALEPGGSYKSGLVNPVAAQQETTVSIPMRFKGAMGGSAVGNEEYPDHEPRASVPYKHYKDLEGIDPKLHEAVTHVADEIHIPRTDLASLVYANSDYDANSRKGGRTGYMGLTPDDARMLDPEGHLDINDPIDNLFMGAMKYKRISNRFGMGTPHAFAAYYGGGDRIRSLLDQDPDEHRRMAPDGTFDFLNKVLGRGEGSGGGAPAVDDTGAGGDQGGDVAAMAAAAQAGAQPQRFTPQRGAVPPMYPNQPRNAVNPPPPQDRDLEPSVGAALAQSRLPTNAQPATIWQPPQLTPAPESYEGPPEGAPPRLRMPLAPSPNDTYEGPPESAPSALRMSPYDPPMRRGAYAEREVPSQATQDVLRDREREDQATPVPPSFYSRGSVVPRQAYDRPPEPALRSDDTGWQRPLPPPGSLGPPVDDTGWQRPMPPGPDDTGWQRPLLPPELTGAGGALQPAPPDTSGGYAVGGAIGSQVAAAVPDSYPGQPPAQPGQVAPAATTGSGAPPAAPRQAIGSTDSMAAQLNQQELARVQGGRPDVIPTGPTQAPAPTSTAAADAARDARAPIDPNNPTAAYDRAQRDPEYARELDKQIKAGAQTAVAGGTTPIQAPAEPGAYTAIGDSLAAHVIRKGGVRGKEDATKVNSYREGDTAVSGWGTQKVLELIEKIPLGQIKDQNVVLSTGASNSPADLAVIPKQIARLKELGAKSVSVLGVGTRPDFAGVNDKLAKFVTDAKDPSVVFAGALPNVGADKVHSTDPVSVFRSAQQALAKGAAPTTGSGGPTPTTAPSAGGDTTAPAANLPAGAPRALAPPGSEPTPTSAPPIDRLKGNGGAMTPASAVRAGAQGTDAVLTHIARNGPRGMSIGDGWDHFEDLLTRAMIMKGDINGIQHAQEYVFSMKHKGAMENLMQAIGSMDDPETAVRFLAKSHAFVTDGTAIGFQVLNNQIYGQKYDEQTHDKIGKPFQVTEQGLRQLAMAQSDRKNFFTNLHNERTANETGRHNRKTEQHGDEQLGQQERQSQRSLEEKQIEFKINQKRYEDAAAQRAAEHATATQQRQDIADQQERVRKETQAAQHAQQTAEKEKDRAQREELAAQREAAAQQVREQRAAEEKAGHAKYADEATDEYFGRGGMAGAATDHAGQPYKGADLTKGRVIFGGMLHHDRTVQSPETAMDYTRGFLSGKYKMAESVGDDGKRYAHIRDEEGNVLATVPSNIWRMYLPKQGTVKAK